MWRLVLLAWLAVLVAAPGAAARVPLHAIVQDDQALLRSGPVVREATLDDLVTLGADTVRIMVVWRDVAADPIDRWAAVDAAVAGAQARGIDVLLTLTGPGPDSASGCRPRDGLCRPDPRRFGAFVAEAGRRYPTVRRWSIWNEPNAATWLRPQATVRGGRVVALSPGLYRTLLREGAAALRRTGHGADTLLIGEVAPVLPRRSGPVAARPTATRAFVRALLCLGRRGRRAAGCSQPLPGTGWAHHAYTANGLRAPDARSPAAALGPSSLGVLEADLRRAARSRVTTRRLPIWLTEGGYQTNPPDTLFGVSPGRQAAWSNALDWLAWRRPQVRSTAQYLVRDEVSPGAFQSGLRWVDGRPKPAFAAYRAPIGVRRRGRRVEVWGMVRSRGARLQLVQRRTGAARTWRTAARVAGRVVVLRRSPRRGAQWRLLWRTADGTQQSSRIAREPGQARRITEGRPRNIGPRRSLEPHMNALRLVVTIIGVCLLAPAMASADPGDLDRGYGKGGELLRTAGLWKDRWDPGPSMAEGAVLTSGGSVLRLTTAGTVDRGFGEHGRLRLGVGEVIARVNGGLLGLHRDPSNLYRLVTLHAFDARGQADRAFPSGGVALPGWPIGRDVVPLGDGGALLARQALRITRDGRVVLYEPGWPTSARDTVLASVVTRSGTFLAIGERGLDLVHLQRDGDLDPRYGAAGVTRVADIDPGWGTSLTPWRDGVAVMTYRRLYIVDRDGDRVRSVPTESFDSRAVVGPDGSLLIVSFSDERRIVVRRLLPSLRYDRRFGHAGRAVVASTSAPVAAIVGRDAALTVLAPSTTLHEITADPYSREDFWAEVTGMRSWRFEAAPRLVTLRRARGGVVVRCLRTAKLRCRATAKLSRGSRLISTQRMTVGRGATRRVAVRGRRTVEVVAHDHRGWRSTARISVR